MTIVKKMSDLEIANDLVTSYKNMYETVQNELINVKTELETQLKKEKARKGAIKPTIAPKIKSSNLYFICLNFIIN